MNRNILYYLFAGTNTVIGLGLITFGIFFSQYWLFVVSAVMIGYSAFMLRWKRDYENKSAEEQSAFRLKIFGINFALMVLTLICFFTALRMEYERIVIEREGPDACITINADEGCPTKVTK